MFTHVIEVGYCFLFIFCILFLDILWKFMVRVSCKAKNKNNLHYNILQKIFLQDIKYEIAKSIYILNFILTCLFLSIFIVLLINMIIQNIIISIIANILGIIYLIFLSIQSIFIGINHQTY